jgi:hypothetical protein
MSISSCRGLEVPVCLLNFKFLVWENRDVGFLRVDRLQSGVWRYRGLISRDISI